MAGLWQIVVPTSADDVNEPTNPSFETGTTGYTAGGTNTIAVSTEQQYRGAYSLKSTIADSNVAFSYAHTFLNANTTYYIKLRLYVPSAYSPSVISLNASGLTGATLTQIKYWNTTETTSAQTNAKDVWVELSATLAIAADVAGNITIAGSAGNVGSVFYFDALYISTNNGLYFDGDESMAFWRGNRHASASQMDYRNRAHGVATNLDDYYVYLGYPSGLDFPGFNHQTRARALGDGSEFLNTYTPQRVGQIPLTLIGASENGYHTRKKAFENIIKPNKSPGLQPFILRSLAANANVPNHLSVRLDNDLVLKRSGFTGNGVMRLLATNPSWYEAGDKYTALTRSSSLSVYSVLGWLNDGTGFSNLGLSSTIATVNAVVIAENRDMYVGGSGANIAGDANADYVARYNRSTGTWSNLFGATTTDDAIEDLEILDDGDLIIVGRFTTIGGSALNRAARWDGSTLSGFGTGFDARVSAVAFDYKRGIVYFGGSFTTANGVAAAGIVRYTLSTGLFTAMDTGVAGGSAAVYDIYVDEANGDVLIGGSFTTIGTAATTANSAAIWDYSSQSWGIIAQAATPGFNGAVHAVSGDASYYYFGGTFTTTGTDTVNRIVRYKRGYLYRPLAMGGTGSTAGLSSTVYGIEYNKVTGKMIIMGQFQATNAGLTCNRVIAWNGSTFESFGIVFAAATSFNAYAYHPSGDYYLAGNADGTALVPAALNNVTNAGTDAAYPVIVFDSSADVIGTEYATLTTLANRTTGAVVNFNDVRILAGSKVTIEFNPTGAKVYRLVGQSKVDLTPGAFTRDSDVSAFVLTPGLNQILLAAMDTGGTPTISCYVLWRNRHNSLSGTAT